MMAMAVRAANACSALSRSPSPPSTSCQHRFRRFLCTRRKGNSCLGFSVYGAAPRRGNGAVALSCYGLRFCSTQGLLAIVMEELQEMRASRRTKARASGKTELVSNKDLSEEKLEKRVLQKGMLLEFRKDSERILLAVAQRPDGKKNWMVSDQNGTVSSIKPQQVTYIIPGIEGFDHSEISDFIKKTESLLDPTLIEYAWEELRETNKAVTAEELAEIIYGATESLESYCAHLLLSKDEIYFSVLESKGYCPVYGPRPVQQVEELLFRKHAKEVAEKELEEFGQLIRSAKMMPSQSKPPKHFWIGEEKIRNRVEALEAYALDRCRNDEQKKMAGNILKSCGLQKASAAAMNLLIDIGYFPIHVNLDLMKLNIPTEYSEEILLAADEVLSLQPDPDKMIRKDLTFLKVYAIDVDEADELDDALSAERMQDGRIKVWIHVADPTRLLKPQSTIDREAMKRGTSVFLPTATYPMFPEKIAMEGMSLKQGHVCSVVSVSIILREDGSIAEYEVQNSIIRPTYMLTYESASELLLLNLEEESELKLLYQAATLRFQWRLQQGAIDTGTIEARVKVSNPDDPEPLINLYVEDQSASAMRLVSEMMILCGEAIASFGCSKNIPLPYRGHPQSSTSFSAFAHLPEGPARTSTYTKVLRAAELDFRKPIRHGLLGLSGYVQFTSPIRRYLDLLAHYQVKALLRGDSLPFSAGQLEGIASMTNVKVRIAKKLSSDSLRYWLLEFLRRQPKDRKYRALVLRFIKDRLAALLLLEIGVQASASVSIGVQIGDEVDIQVEESHPRADILTVKEV
ncbi:ribonuclease II, chloroplastic/mitochondrial isoform X2 [Nymphaea colorata]|uniref:ribonuclease II, chloroplastic/mitochondrial isoform X2 n=1 Tax=Nymphaea colorata TaxID=210225 RepID=UPI00129EAF89|nr:ribonuclease II, chloroplastic/mitochondrial isoform X2 [Nymphaea colorata]